MLVRIKLDAVDVPRGLDEPKSKASSRQDERQPDKGAIYRKGLSEPGGLYLERTVGYLVGTRVLVTLQ